MKYLYFTYEKASQISITTTQGIFFLVFIKKSYGIPKKASIFNPELTRTLKIEWLVRLIQGSFAGHQ